MLLAVDIGNTTIHAGIFADRELGPTWRLATDHDRLADEYGIQLASLLRASEVDPAAIDGAILSCVVPPLQTVFQNVCRRFFGVEPLMVGPNLRGVPLIRYDRPSDVGADRLCDAVAAVDRYGPGPLIVVDFGTGTVFDGIDADGSYVGGAIAPGIGIASEALFARASRLPKIDIERPPSAIGTNTVTAIQSGLLFGYVGLVEGIIARFKQELGGGRVIGTGGWSARIGKETTALDIIDADLTLEGLQLLYSLNAEGTP